LDRWDRLDSLRLPFFSLISFYHSPFTRHPYQSKIPKSKKFPPSQLPSLLPTHLPTFCSLSSALCFSFALRLSHPTCPLPNSDFPLPPTFRFPSTNIQYPVSSIQHRQPSQSPLFIAQSAKSQETKTSLDYHLVNCYLLSFNLSRSIKLPP